VLTQHKINMHAGSEGKEERPSIILRTFPILYT